jgi:hypothetical protein
MIEEYPQALADFEQWFTAEKACRRFAVASLLAMACR